MASAVSAACAALAFFSNSHLANLVKEHTMFEGLFQPMHLLVIFGIALLVFGPKKLPELGIGIGEGIRGFKSAIKAEEEKPATEMSVANDLDTGKE
jgi:sec-independent protein translocase protein TatA